MLPKGLLNLILHNEALTRGLADPEARILIEWLVEQAEVVADTVEADAVAQQVQRLCRRARSIGRFVTLWCHVQQHGAAIQLAGVERFAWPLPSSRSIDPCELMHSILDCEASVLAA